jgi:arylsulfatase A-like enzyme
MKAAALLLIAATAAAAPRPNIVVILTDDMGWSDIGCYGSEIPTPNLDKLAAGGVRFTQFYNTARCCPTRASLLTGLYPHQAGVGHMTEDRGRDGYRGELNERCVTIAEALRPAGYRNYAVGKWHVSRNIKDDGPQGAWPRQRGFDRFYGTVTGGGNFFDPGNLTRDNTNISPFNDPEYKPAQYYYTDAITDHAVRFAAEHVRERKNEPFFLYVAYTAAHWPLHAPEDEIARFKGKYDGGYAPVRKGRLAKQKQLGLLDASWTLPPLAGDWEKMQHKRWESRCMEVYAAQVSRMDTGVGRIVEQLKKDGVLDNTLVVYMQDNGGCAEEIRRNTSDRRAEKPTLPTQAPDFVRHEVHPKQTREGWPVLGGPLVMPGPGDTFQSYGRAWANVSNTPFREYKHWVHEGGISTPLIAHWPAGIAARGELRTQPGHLVDIMATCLDVAGAGHPKERAGVKTTPPEGRSLLPAFAGRPIERDIFWEHEGNRAVRSGDWKAVAKGPGGKWELYNVATDRTEQNDLAEKEPGRLKDLVAKWEAYAKRANVLPWVWKPQYGANAASAADANGQPEFDDEARGSNATRFALKAGDDLPGEKAPRLTGRGFKVSVEITEAGDGVLVAQGGSSHGWALHVREGRAIFAVRRAGKLSQFSGPAISAPVLLHAALQRDGRIALTAGSVTLDGKVDGPLTKHPQDGLQVGRDGGGLVGDYKDESAYRGKTGGVVIEVSSP